MKTVFPVFLQRKGNSTGRCAFTAMPPSTVEWACPITCGRMQRDRGSPCLREQVSFVLWNKVLMKQWQSPSMHHPTLADGGRSHGSDTLDSRLLLLQVQALTHVKHQTKEADTRKATPKAGIFRLSDSYCLSEPDICHHRLSIRNVNELHYWNVIFSHWL